MQGAAGEREPPDISNTVYHVDTQTVILDLVDKLHRLEMELEGLKHQQIVMQEQRIGSYALPNAVHRIGKHLTPLHITADIHLNTV